MSQESLERTLLDAIHRLAARGERTASLVPTKNHWRRISWQVTADSVFGIARSFLNLGIAPGDRVLMLCQNCWEWSITDIALLLIGAVPVPIYPQTHPDDLDLVLKKSQCLWFFVESASLARTLAPLAKKNLGIEPRLILLLDDPQLEYDYVHWNDLLEKGLRESIPSTEKITQMSQRIRPHDLATLVFTSGTTGEPQLVEVTHRQILSEVAESFPYLGVTAQDLSLNLLPFAHILGRVEHWGHYYFGFQMAYSRSIDQLREHLLVVKPTVLVGVPRIFEKIYGFVLAQIARNPLHRTVHHSVQSVHDHVPFLKQNFLFKLAQEKLLHQPIQAVFGGELRWALSGGAALNSQILHFFKRAGILILEGYGLTETTGAVTVNTPFDHYFGSVGKPIGDVQLRFGEDAEIFVHSHKVALACADADGWLATGDFGHLADSGHLMLTGRKKELIKTSAGKYVSPMKIESFLKALPFVNEAAVFGNGERFCVALVFLEKDFLLQHPVFSKELETVAFEEWGKNKKLLQWIQMEIALINQQLSSFESIRRFAVIPRLPSWGDGTLTPTLKLKREQLFRQNIATLRRLFT